MNAHQTVVCISEDRPESEPGIRVLIASIARSVPDVDIKLWFHANPSMQEWARIYPQLQILAPISKASDGWNIKPTVLVEALGRGYREAIWIDSDVVVVRDWRTFTSVLATDDLIATEEANWGSRDDGHGERARAWSFRVGRGLPSVINTCFLRVTRSHLRLLEAWRICLENLDYRRLQELPTTERPVYFMGDQEVLTALLCSEQFCSIPIHNMRLGREVIQAFGLKAFTVCERIAFLLGKPPIIVHQQGTKPWSKNRGSSANSLRNRLLQCYLDVSPYLHFARHFRSDLDENKEWLNPTSPIGRLLTWIGAGSYTMTGLPLAFLFDAVFGLASVKKWLGFSRPIPKSPVISLNPSELEKACMT